MLSRRSLILGSGAAFIARPALALLSPLSLRSSLAYPGGAPGINLAHPASQGIRFSGVGPGMANLATGARPTANGTMSSSTQAFIGPAAFPGTTSSYYATAGISETPPSITFGAILTTIGNSGAFGMIMNTHAQGTTNNLFYISTATVEMLAGGTVESSGITLTAGVPYFIAVSIVSALRLTFVVMNLATGVLKVSTFATSHLINAQTTTYSIGGGGSAGANCNAYIAAVMHSTAFLNPNQLIQWSQAPWDFWYPPTQQNLIAASVANSGGGGRAGQRALIGVGQ